MAMHEAEPSFADGIIEGLQEAAAWKRGELALETVHVDPMPAERIRAIRRKAARSTRDFETQFGVPAATMNNWEQGRRKPDPAARVLLQVIEKNPDAVRQAIASKT
jgi:putative transcriptional regulator